MENKKLMNCIWITMCIFSITGCGKDDAQSDEGGASHLEITVKGNETRQTIHSFGASDAWTCQFVGKNWPDGKKNQIADWLFSTELDDQQNPEGIGLTAWRFNIGGGSAEQGTSSGIGDEWRRSESFMTGVDTYDWNKQAGQRWFLKAAKQRGVNQFIGFVNSPPVAITKNGKAFSSDKNQYNLSQENYTAFADYLANVTNKMKEREGISFEYISPFNEPQWDWTDGGQEGTPAQNSEIAAVSKIIDQSFTNHAVSAKLEVPESAQLNYLYADDNKAGRGSQINAFFNPSSPHYIGDLPHMAQKIAGHSYYTTWPLNKLSETRTNVKNAIEGNSKPLEFWMSEYCILEDNNEISGGGRDLSMNPALYVSRVVFSDLVFANASSWQWWLAISPYDYKDGLVYIDNNKNDGLIYDSKLLWAFGNFSRFIRPGMKRVVVARNDGRSEVQTLEGVMATAFVSDDKSKVSIVIINYKENKIPVKVNFENITDIQQLKYYLTDGKPANNLSYQGTMVPGDSFEIPARSIITITNQD